MNFKNNEDRLAYYRSLPGKSIKRDSVKLHEARVRADKTMKAKDRFAFYKLKENDNESYG